MELLRSFDYEPAQPIGGYTDRILRVDLGTREIVVQELPPDFKNKYTGGRGYAIKFIWDGTQKDTRYDSPENLLVLASGPLGNEPAFPGTGKFIVGTISPLTDTFVDSNVGGHFGPLLKLAGFDALVVSGVSQDDVILTIDGDKGTINILEAPVYEGDSNSSSLSYGEQLLLDAGNSTLSDNMAAVSAGIGSVNSRFGIINSLFYDRRRNRVRCKQAGRGGTGTVMRVKGLHGVTVKSSRPKVNGNNAIDKKMVRKAGEDIKKVISECDSKQLNLEAWGTTILSEYMNNFHLFPVNNYQYGQSPESSKVFARVFLDNYFSTKIPDGCYYGCNLACAKSSENVMLTRGPQAGRRVNIDGPEYETVGACSSMGIFDPQFVLEYNWYCDEYGLDTISTGVAISFFMECFQRGYIDRADVGYDLAFGSMESADKLLHEIASGTGFGKVVGQGVMRGKKWVADRYSSRNKIVSEKVLGELGKFAMEVKGLEFSMYVTKESLAQQGGYGFALKGPQHDEAWLVFIDLVHKELPTFEQKANALKWFPLIRTWFNATGLCKLPWIDVRNPAAAATAEPTKNLPTLDYFVDFLNGTTGSNKSLQGILDDSERIYTLQKLINLRQGKGTRESDQIPLRAMAPVYLNEYEARTEYYDNWLKERINGTSMPETMEQKHRLLVEKRLEDFQKLCDVVYEKKGYTSDGVPKRETVEKFGLLDKKADELLKIFGQ